MNVGGLVKAMRFLFCAGLGFGGIPVDCDRLLDHVYVGCLMGMCEADVVVTETSTST